MYTGEKFAREVMELANESTNWNFQIVKDGTDYYVETLLTNDKGNFMEVGCGIFREISVAGIAVYCCLGDLDAIEKPIDLDGMEQLFHIESQVIPCNIDDYAHTIVDEIVFLVRTAEEILANFNG